MHQGAITPEEASNEEDLDEALNEEEAARLLLGNEQDSNASYTPQLEDSGRQFVDKYASYNVICNTSFARKWP